MENDPFPKRQRSCPSCGVALVGDARVAPAWTNFWRCPKEGPTFVEPLDHNVKCDPVPVSAEAYEAASRLPGELLDNYGTLTCSPSGAVLHAEEYGRALVDLVRARDDARRDGRGHAVGDLRGAQRRALLEVLKKIGEWQTIPIGEPMWARLEPGEIEMLRSHAGSIDVLAERLMTSPELFGGRGIDRFEWDRIAKTLAPLP